MAEVLGDPRQAPGDRGGSPAWGLGFHKDSVCLHLPHYPDFPSIACCLDPDTSPCAGHDQGPHSSVAPPAPFIQTPCQGQGLPHCPQHHPSAAQGLPSILGSTGHGQSMWGDLWGLGKPQHLEKHHSAGDQWGTRCLLLVTGPGLLIEGRSHCPTPGDAQGHLNETSFWHRPRSLGLWRPGGCFQSEGSSDLRLCL